MDFRVIYDSLASLLNDGVPIDHPIVAMNYISVLHLVKDRLVDIVQRPGSSGYFLEYTVAGFKWNADNLKLQERVLQTEYALLQEREILRGQTAVPTENTPSTAAVGVRFRDLKAGAKFHMFVGSSPHRLRYRKVSDAEEDNTVMDSEKSELCSFPADQLVIPALKGDV